MNTPELLTIGYEGTTSAEVLALLRASGVKLLIDVRAVASSRKPGFSKTRLAAGLQEAGIGYLHLQGLGTPKEGRQAVRSGQPRKMVFGPWMLAAMRLLRHGKALRGTALDVFGKTEERRMERALPGEFRAGVEAWLLQLTPASYARTAEWVEAWAGVKGYGHIKLRNLEATRARLAAITAAPADTKAA